MKRLVLNRFYWRISNDPSIWWWFQYWEWVEARENTKKIKLSKWTQTVWILTTNINNPVKSYLYENSTNFIRLHNNWEITNLTNNDIDNWNIITDLPWNIYNSWNITSNIKNWFIIWSTNLYRWPYDWNDISLGIYNSSSIWLINEPSFDAVWSWTVWTWWFISWWEAYHTTWWATLLQPVTSTLWKKYRCEIQCWTITTWTCQIFFEANVIKTLTSADSWKTITVITPAWLWWTNNFYFDPTNTFDWRIKYVNLQEYYITEQAYNFNVDSPYIIYSNLIYVWNWNKITRIDTTWWSWTISDLYSIDLDYTIKWITRIGDQFYIYATNWSTSRQYLWDWISNSYSWAITWIDKNIQNVANFANRDYVITKTNFTNKSWLRQVNWYNLDNLFTNTENSNRNLERIYFNSPYTNAIETIWDRLIVPWIKWLYTYWNFTSWLPKSLIKEYIHLWWDVTAISYNESNSWRITFSYTWTINGVSWIYESFIQITQWYSNTTEYAWWIQNYIWWEVVSNIKNIEKVTIWCKTPTNTRINIYTKNLDRLIKYANIPYDYTTLPTVWSIYTFWWNTYTIYYVTDMWNYCILHTTYTWTWTWIEWIFTKVSWTWDNTFYCQKVRYDFKLVSSVSNNTIRRFTTERINGLDISEELYECEVWIELLTSNSSISPELSDINIYFNEVSDD